MHLFILNKISNYYSETHPILMDLVPVFISRIILYRYSFCCIHIMDLISSNLEFHSFNVQIIFHIKYIQQTRNDINTISSTHTILQ